MFDIDLATSATRNKTLINKRSGSAIHAVHNRLKKTYIHVSVWMFADEVACSVPLSCLSVKRKKLVLAASKHKQKGKQLTSLTAQQ